MLNIPYIVNNANEIWHKIRWKDGIPTCSCGCADVYKLGDGRYKCKDCGKVFSDTTNTILHKSKIDKSIWLCVIFKFAVCPECSALSLKNEFGINYKTAYKMLQKLRYLVGKEKLTLEGVCSVDEAYIGAEWRNVHLKKKMSYMKENGYLDSHNRYNKNTLLQAVSSKKYHILSLTDESGKTVLLHCPNPINKDTIKYVLSGHRINKLITDESSLYKGLNIPVEQSNHSCHKFITNGGLTSNRCETNFSWVKRKWNGVFTHTSEKYLQLYLWQRQWSFNCYNMTADERFHKLLGLAACNVVTHKMINEFDYTKGFKISKRKAEEEFAKETLDEFGYCIDSIEGKYKTYRK